MRIRVTALALLLISSAGYAAVPVEYATGRVIYSGKCENKWAFSYFDGVKLQIPCIGSTEEVPLADFVHLGRISLCHRQVRVNQGTLEGDILYARDIEEGSDCSDGDRVIP